MMSKADGRNDYDVVVIGAGPAGATAATLLARAGHRVAVLERGRFPRFHVGESLIPQTYWPLRRLGVLERMKQSCFPRKYSVQFVSKAGQYGQPFYFFETNPHESSVTWQVLRSEFDQMLLDNARHAGAEVFENTRVLDVLFEGPRCAGVRAQQAEDEPIAWRARVVVDASGQRSLLANRLSLRRTDAILRKSSVWTYYEGAQRDGGIDEGATLILHTNDKRGWFWYIPLSENRVSVGVVGSAAALLGGARSPEQIFSEQVETCPAVKERLQTGEPIGEYHVTRDFSYHSDQAAGDGWVLVGDALGFLDPIYSSGVLLALVSGEMAADAIDAALRANDTSPSRLGAWAPRFLRGMEMFRRLVYAFYTPSFSFGAFLKEHPECRRNLIDLLVGDVFKDGVEEIFRKMGDVRPAPDA